MSIKMDSGEKLFMSQEWFDCHTSFSTVIPLKSTKVFHIKKVDFEWNIT